MRDRTSALRAVAFVAMLAVSCSDNPNGPNNVLVTGVVRLPDGATVAGATVGFFEPAMAVRQRPGSVLEAPSSPASDLPIATTDTQGRFAIAMPEGRYEVWIGGVADSGFMPMQVAVVTLQPPRASLELRYDAYRVSGQLVFLNASLGAGTVFVTGSTSTTRAEMRNSAYSLLLPAGTYDFWAGTTQEYALYSGVPRVKYEGITVSADTTIDLSLDGHFVRGTVTGPDGLPLYGAIVAATAPNASASNYTASNGTYGLHLPTGEYEFTVTPPPGADSLDGVISFEFIDAPRTIDFEMQLAPPPPGP
jgi:hypothetical protein